MTMTKIPELNKGTPSFEDVNMAEKVTCMREESTLRLRELLNHKKELTDALCDRMPIKDPELMEKYRAFSEELDSLIAAEAKLLSDFEQRQSLRI